MYPWAENGGHVAARANRMSVHLSVSTWRPPMTAASAMCKCNKSREQSGGEKPRATTVLKMTHDEIRAAVSAAAADEPAV